MPFKMTLFFLILLIFGCSSTPVKNNVSEVTPVSKTNEEQVVSKSTNKALPSSYKEISFQNLLMLLHIQKNIESN